MRRRFFVAFTVLLVVMLATCDLFEPAARDSEPLFTDDGRPMVRLSIGLGNKGASRAISSDQDPETFVNTTDGYYEVAFIDNGTIYRAEWYGNDEGSIAVPMGIYTGATKAILFAGRDSDKTLLAIGIISEIDGDSVADDLGGVAQILADTESVTFQMFALESGVTGNKATSSFFIEGPTQATPGPVDFTAKPIASYRGDGFVFTIPEHGYTNSVDDSLTATDSSLLNKTKNIVGLYKVKYGSAINDGSIFDGVIVKDDDWVNAENYSNPTGKTVELVTRFPTQGEAVPINSGYGEFYFNIDVEDLSATEDGLHKIWIDVPVCAIGSEDSRSSPVTWHIRGGLDNEELDSGNSATSTGGAFLLNVGGLTLLNIGQTW